MLSILVIGFGLLVASCAAVLIAYANDGAQQSIGWFIMIMAIVVIVGGGFLIRFAGG